MEKETLEEKLSKKSFNVAHQFPISDIRDHLTPDLTAEQIIETLTTTLKTIPFSEPKMNRSISQVLEGKAYLTGDDSDLLKVDISSGKVQKIDLGARLCQALPISWDTTNLIGYRKAGHIFFSNEHGDIIELKGIKLHKLNEEQTTIRIRNQSLAFATGQKTAAFVPSFSFGSLNKDDLVHLQGLDVKERVADVCILSSDRVLVVWKHSEMFIFNQDGKLVTKFKPEELHFANQQRAVALSEDGQWLFICYYSLKEKKPEIKVFKITLEDKIIETDHHYIPQDFVNHYQAAINHLSVVNFRGRPVIVGHQVQSTKKILVWTINDAGKLFLINEESKIGNYEESYHSAVDKETNKVVIVGKDSQLHVLSLKMEKPKK